MAKLSDIFTLQMGKTPARAKDEYWNNGDNNWVSISDLSTYNKYVGDTKETISDLAVKDSGIKPVPADTVIMSFKLTLGKTAITVKPTFTNEAIMAFIPNGNYPVCPSYFYHFFGGRDWSKGTNRAVMGVTLNKATLGEIDVATPSLEEQTKIAEHLDRVDELISYRKQQLSKLDELVKSRFIEMFGDPVRNEKGWPMVTLGDVAEIRIGPFGTLLHKEDYIIGGHPLVNPSHIIDGKIMTDEKLTITDEKFEELSAYHLSVGDVVLGRRGEMGRCAVVFEEGLLCGTGSMVIRPNEKMKPYFLQNIISNPTYKKIIEDKAVGVTMLNLNVPIVSALAIPQLPIDMQEQFIEFMHQTDKLKFEVKEALEKLEILKKSLMQQYFG